MGHQVTVAADRSGQRPHPHQISLDLSNLSDSSGLARADNDPGTLPDQSRVTGILHEGPRQPGVVLGVEVNAKVDVDAHRSVLLSLMVGVNQVYMPTTQQPSNQLLELVMGDGHVWCAESRHHENPVMWNRREPDTR